MYSKYNGGEFIENLRNEWKDNYDFVLVDSRTGVTDIGGICTIQLPDVLILLFTATQQAYQGILDIAAKVGSSTFNRGGNMKNMMDSCKILIRSKTISQRMRQWIQRKNFVPTQTAQQEAR